MFRYTVERIALFIVLITPFFSLLAGESTKRGNPSSENAVTDSSKARMPKVPHKKAADTAKSYQSGTVVVTGARNEVLVKDSPVRVEVADREQIKETGMINLGNMLQEQTGIAIMSNLRNGVQMMGLNPDYTMILIDGQPVIGRVAGVIDLSRISVGNIEQVEIVKGPMSSLYGSEALAGVINLITRKPEAGWNGRVYSQIIQRGPFEAQAELTHSGETTDLTLFANLKNAQSFELHQDSLRSPFSGFTDLTLQSRVKYYLQSNLSLTGNLRLFHTETNGEFVQSFFSQVATNKGSVIQNDGSMTLNMDWTSGKARLSGLVYASLYAERYNFDVDQGGAGTADDYDRRLLRASLQYDVLWNLKNRFTVGGEFLYDDATGTRYPDKPLYRTFVGFGQWEGNPTDWISYALSARHDANSVYGQSFNPKFSLLLKVSDDISVRTSVGTGFKAPDFRQLFVEFSNRLAGTNYNLIGARRVGKDLEPEKSLSFDAGITANLGVLSLAGTNCGIWNVDIRGFRNNIRNLIEVYKYDRIEGIDVYSYKNLSRVSTQGIEGNIRTLVPLHSEERLTAALGYQYLDANDMEILDAIDAHTAIAVANAGTGETKELTRSEYGGLWSRSRHSGNFRIQYDNDDLGFGGNIRVQYVGRFGDEALNKNAFAIVGSNLQRTKVLDRADEYAPSYWLFNIAVSKFFGIKDGFAGLHGIRVNVGVNNLLDEMNLRSVPGLVGRQFFTNIALELR